MTWLHVCLAVPGLTVASPEVIQLLNARKDENCGSIPTRVLKFVVEVIRLVFDVSVLKN